MFMFQPKSFPLVVAFLLPIASSLVWADDSDDTLRFYLNKSELVIVGKVVNEPFGVSGEAGVENYGCQIEVEKVVAGELKVGEEPIKVTVTRFTGTGGEPKKGESYLLFLKSYGGRKGYWQTADFWFGIMPAATAPIPSLERLAELPHKPTAAESRDKLLGKARFALIARLEEIGDPHIGPPSAADYHTRWKNIDALRGDYPADAMYTFILRVQKSSDGKRGPDPPEVGNTYLIVGGEESDEPIVYWAEIPLVK